MFLQYFDQVTAPWENLCVRAMDFAVAHLGDGGPQGHGAPQVVGAPHGLDLVCS